MKRLLIISILFLPLSVHGQEKVYTLTLTNSQLAVIGSALQERPYKDVNPVIEMIARQMQAQNAAQEQKQRDEQKKIDDLKKQAKPEGSQP